MNPLVIAILLLSLQDHQYTNKGVYNQMWCEPWTICYSQFRLISMISVNNITDLFHLSCTIATLYLMGINGLNVCSRLHWYENHPSITSMTDHSNWTQKFESNSIIEKCISSRCDPLISRWIDQRYHFQS